MSSFEEKDLNLDPARSHSQTIRFDSANASRHATPSRKCSQLLEKPSGPEYRRESDTPDPPVISRITTRIAGPRFTIAAYLGLARWQQSLTVVGCFMLMFNSWGLVNAYGTYQSYYKQHLLAGQSNATLNLIGAMQCFIVLGLSMIVGRVLDAGHFYRLTIIGGLLVTIASFLISIRSITASYGSLLAVQGILMPLGMACMFVPSSQIVAGWFVKYKVLFMGVVACGASIAGLVYPMMLKHLIAIVGFHTAQRYVSILTALTSLSAAALAIPNPDRVIRIPKSWTSTRTYIDGECFRRGSSLGLVVAIGLLFTGFYAVFFNLEDWAADTGLGRMDETPNTEDITLKHEVDNDAIRTFWLLSIMNASSTFGRIGILYIGNFVGALRTHAAVTSTAALLLLAMWSTVNNMPGGLSFVVIYGIISGADIALPPSSMADILGEDPEEKAKLGQWTGLMYGCAAPFSLAGPVIGGLMIGLNGLGYLPLQLCNDIAAEPLIGGQSMEDDVLNEIHEESDFWQRLESVIATSCRTEEDIDDVLRQLLEADVFVANRAYVRRQFLYCLLQDDDASTLHLAAAICLYDGRGDEGVFETMQEEGAFSRLVELVSMKPNDDNALHRLLLELLFEMSRIRKLDRNDLATVSDNFILYLFQLIEALSDDADDPYHYPVIRVLLSFNEQYMCFASTPHTPGLTNRILKLLSAHGPEYRTFGENLILLLNRETALGPQLLILKLLYLLFTTPSTYEYFYTNDLHVLVDVIVRNLLDLDLGNYDMESSSEDITQEGQRALRHTYLRVLCPLLKNTQLAREGSHYKREELRKLLNLLVNRSSAHFAPVDETVLRLVLRCKQIPWLREHNDPEDEIIEQRLAEVAPGEQAVAKKLLGMSLDAAAESSLSVLEVSAKIAKQKPSVPAPRRKNRKPPGHGVANTRLDVPRTAVNVSNAMQQKERSPFADDDEEVLSG
ncbi:hypothetical protein AMS68_005750 [Peltaster fructicola]|uniref:SPIN90/Ldb17 leucine-rich domain-containing protein n=1 Tax=Peltaster fructicola TaxID=286661 RepID=A0A6H0XZP6_9PEZI|nr:hypothetical protein AMS68_005750 [Peltaster fructicola]